jgi:hypothetical protein
MKKSVMTTMDCGPLFMSLLKHSGSIKFHRNFFLLLYSSLCFRYAATGDPEAKKNAWKSFEAMEFLNNVTGTSYYFKTDTSSMYIYIYILSISCAITCTSL